MKSAVKALEWHDRYDIIGLRLLADPRNPVGNDSIAGAPFC